MAEVLLKGAQAAGALSEALRSKAEELKAKGVVPCLAILRVGARGDDLSYERGAMKRCEKIGIAVRQVVLPEDVTQEALLEEVRRLNEDASVHGVLMFRPLPKHLDDEAVRAALAPEKDMDGITDGSMTAVYAGTKNGYAPCTAQACVELLKHYNIAVKGKRVVCVMSGGNIDVSFISNIIERGLVARNRRMKFIVKLIDKPGSLVGLLNVIAGAGANIITIEHDKLTARLGPNEISVHIACEVGGESHGAAVISALTGAGYLVELE